MPVVSGVVMPAGLLGLLAMPFGLDGIFWQAMDQGIAWMVTVAQWVAALPGATGQMAAFGVGPLVIVTIGIVVLGLFRTPLRWAGAGVALAAAVWAVSTPRPDILIADDGRNVAVRGVDGRLHMMRTAKDTFVTREWLAADADPRALSDSSLSDGVSCDETGCVIRAFNGRYVTLVLKPDALADDCVQAAVIVSSWPPPPDCAALVIGPDMLHQQGTLALYRERDGFAIQAVRPRGWDRPWSPAAVANDINRRPARTVRQPPIDATPADADQQADD